MLEWRRDDLAWPGATSAAVSGKPTSRKAEPSGDDLRTVGPQDRAAEPAHTFRMPEKHGGKANRKREKGKRREG